MTSLTWDQGDLLPLQASPPSFLTAEGEAEGGGVVELGSTVEEIQQSPRPAARVWGRRGGTQVQKSVCFAMHLLCFSSYILDFSLVYFHCEP